MVRFGPLPREPRAGRALQVLLQHVAHAANLAAHLHRRPAIAHAVAHVGKQRDHRRHHHQRDGHRHQHLDQRKPSRSAEPRRTMWSPRQTSRHLLRAMRRDHVKSPLAKTRGPYRGSVPLPLWPPSPQWSRLFAARAAVCHCSHPRKGPRSPEVGTACLPTNATSYRRAVPPSIWTLFGASQAVAHNHSTRRYRLVPHPPPSPAGPPSATPRSTSPTAPQSPAATPTAPVPTTRAASS